MRGPFAESVVDYARAGWPCVIPVPVADKYPPPVGYTGAAGRDTDPMQLVLWAESHADWSVAVRLPDGVIGLDVDHYAKGTVDKRGADTLAELVAKWGPLPATWASTARGTDTAAGPSRIMFYRVPVGRYATKMGDAIDIIQRHHRYAVVWPSPHHEVGALYRWYGPDGAAVDAVPKPDELPELPAAWVSGLREGASEAGPAAADEVRGRALLDALRYDVREPCAEMANARGEALRLLAAVTVGGRHDTATERTHHLVQLGAAGHPGAGEALAILAGQWAHLTSGENRGDEFERMMLTSARKAVSVVGARPVDRDPCLIIGSIPVAAPAPADDRPGVDQPDPIEPPRELHPLEIIGAHPFDPRGHLDQTMGDAVLARTQPILRFAHDARTWLLRGPEVWESRLDLTGWAVALLADRMPLGNPQGEKDSEERAQADRRKRFMTSTASRGVAGKMRDRVAGGVHPSALKLADLDREPWLLWAGGVGWDLSASGERPTQARIDPATPHRHSAGTTPDLRPTPLWDAFTAAVWPDAELRAWALRVLAIAFTGYSDKALPILVGEKDRGKTQVVALLMSVLGTYAHAADPRLLGGADKAHASIIYALMGRRLSFIDEGPREGRLGQERLKQLTGGGELTGNAMNQNPVTWAPSHTLVLTANEEPTLTDPAVRGRVRLIPCEGDPAQVIAARAALGHTNQACWRAEAPGVLAVMMREAAAWLAEPSSALTSAAPEAYRYRAEEIAAEQDPVTQWIDDETEPDEAGERSRTLYEAFVAWARSGNVHPGRLPSETKWGRELTRRGFAARHTEGGKRRPMRLRQRGGWFPTPTQPVRAEPTRQPTEPPTPPPADGLAPQTDGLLTGSPATRQGEERQVNPNNFENPDGLTGSSLSSSRSAHTRTHPKPGGNARQPVIPVRTRQPAKPEREAVKAAARLQAILDAAGAPVLLPALVDRGGLVQAIDLSAAGATLAGVIERGALTVDVETSGYPVGHADHRLRTVQLGDKGAAVVFDATDRDQADMARIALAAAGRLHAHSATADLGPLEAAGLVTIDAWARMYDTVIPAKLADPQSTGSDPGLKKLSAAVLGESAATTTADAARAALFKAGRWLTDTELTTPVERSGWAQVDSACSTMVRYAASDVLDTAALAERLPEVDPRVLERERAVQRVTARVTHRGLRIDGERVAALTAEHTAARDIAGELVRAYEIDNPGSNKQVGERLIALGVALPQTATGRPSVAAAVLEKLRGTPGHPGALVAAVLDYRHHDTVLGTYLEPYRQLVERGDGRARPTIYTLGTDTGRMSCVRPNLQQLPREGGVRACITADPGHVLVSADFSGVELRVAAALSGDTSLREMIAAGTDLHWLIARQVWGPDATKGDRYAAKRIVFGRLYGGGVPTLAAQAGVSEYLAASAVDVLDSYTPELAAWSRQLRDMVRAGAVAMPTYAGRVIHLTRDQPHKAPNYAIQGTARELLVDAIERWEQTRWAGSVVLPVHDEVITMVRAEDAEAATAELARCMTTDLYGVAIVAEASTPACAWQDAV